MVSVPRAGGKFARCGMRRAGFTSKDLDAMNHLLRAGVLPTLGLALALLQGSMAHAASFELIARNGAVGVGMIDFNVRPSIAESGKVAFVGTRASNGTQAIFIGGISSTSLGVIPTGSAGYLAVQSVQLANDGQVVFGNNPLPPTALSGVYRRTSSGAIVALHQSPLTKYGLLRMSANGAVVFSDIVNGAGAVYRVLPGGTKELMIAGGTFYNTGQFDIDDTGRVVVQAEYFDPNAGLARGVLWFNQPGESLPTADSTIERANIGVQPRVAVNNLGQVAFTLNSTVTIQYFNPPIPGGGAPAGSLTLEPGVYVAQPTPFGVPFTPTPVALASANGYSDFGNVDISDQGLVVFEATAGGKAGIFKGPNPVLDAIAVAGTPIMVGNVAFGFSAIKLGQLNNQGQLTMLTRPVAAIANPGAVVWRVQP